MKKYLFIVTIIALTNVCKAQDQLFKNDNSKLLVKVTEVAPDEIKYKLYSNLNGPTYVVNKSEVSLLIYENGQHEVMNTSNDNMGSTGRALPGPSPRSLTMSKADSLKFYKYSQSLSLNFLNFLNMEVGVIYQKDFLKSNCNIIIPLAIGIQDPAITQSVYFNNSNGNLQLNRKLFEVGFGFNYYPSLRFPVNYYVGPAIRFMQYDCKQTYSYGYSTGQQYPYNYNTTVQTANGTLSRYCVSITNGFIFRTRSRLMINLFGSLGFKNDVATTKIIDQTNNQVIKPISNPIGLYFWTGFALGFCF